MGGSTSASDLADVTGLVSRYNLASVAGSDGVKFTSWADSKGTNNLVTASNGGLTYRSAPAGFGTLAAAEIAANTDGGLAQPFSIVVFGKMGGAPVNGEFMCGNSTFYPMGKGGGSKNAQGSGGNAIFWNSLLTTVAVYVVVWNGVVASQCFVNGVADGAAGNLNSTAFSGDFGIGKPAAGAGVAGSQMNEVAIYNKALSTNEMLNTIVPYFRTKSGLAL
jgi:hypothetical protein